MVHGRKVELSEQDLQQEQLWLSALGLRLPPYSFLSRHPFEQPFSARSLIMPSRWHASPVPARVQAKDVAADLEILQLVLQSCYPGWETAGQKGWDWEKFFRDWFSRLAQAAAAELDTEEAFRPWEQYLEFQLDNHSGPIAPFAVSVRSRSAFARGSVDGIATRWRDQDGVEGTIDRNEPSSQFRPVMLAADGGTKLLSVSALSYPGGKSEWREVFCGGGWIPLETVNGLGHYPTETACGLDMQSLHYGKLAERIVYCRVPTLSGDLRETVVQGGQLPQQAEDLDAIILDLRGNKGGSAHLVLDLLEAFLPLGRKQIPTVSIRFKESLLTAAIRWGAAQAMITGRNSTLPDRMRTLVQRELDKLTSSPTRQSGPVYRAHASDWCFRQHAVPNFLSRGKPLLLVLMDSRCASDGEFLAYSLASQGHCVLAGANSAGVAQFAQPGRLVLPHTRLSFRMATAATDIYGDNRPFDGRGLNADLLIPDGFPLDRYSLLNLVSSVRRQISDRNG